MGSITIEVDDEEQQFSGRKIIECNSCGETKSEENVDNRYCPDCEAETEWKVVAEEVNYKINYSSSGAETIEDMASRLLADGKQLQMLGMGGFSLKQPVRTPYAKLRREK